MARILIVDDEPDMRLAVRNVLRLRGYEIAEAGDGPAALAQAKESRPDLVLLDMRLPGMDGIEVLAGLKKIDDSVPVVMITGYGHIQSAVDVMKLGASEYLQKPFENAQLVETVRRFTGPGPAARRPAPMAAAEPAARPEKPAPAVRAVPFRPAPARDQAPWRPVSFIAAALVTLLAVLGSYWYVSGRSASYFREYPGVSSNISALVWSGGKLYSGDWLTQSVYLYSRDGDGLRLEKTFPLDKTHISGLAVADGMLYVADPWKKTIDARRLGPGLPLVRSYPAPGKVGALFYDGEYLWTCDSEGNAVLRRTDPELTPAVSFRLPEKPDQIFKDGKYLWTAVSSTGKLYRHRLDDSLTLDGVYTLRTSRPGYPLSAFSWKDGRLWFARDGLGTVFEAGKGELERE